MTHSNRSRQRLFDVLDLLVDDRVGIVRDIMEVHRDAGEPDFFHFWATACDVRAFTRQSNFAQGGGAAVSRDAALAKAVGEAVERYCSAIFDVDEIPLCSYRDAPFPCVAPHEFALHSREQYELPGFLFVPFEEDTTVRWVRAIDAARDEPCFVPAAFVFVPYYYYRGSGDSPITQPISTGLACHAGFAEAAVRAVCEVIERDAFTITWQARLSPPQIVNDTLSAENLDLVRRFERARHRVTLFDITTDVGVPTILAVATHPSPEAVALTVAAATSPSPEDAARKALEELDHTRAFQQKLKSHTPRVPSSPDHEHVTDQTSHLNFWGDHANAPLADFLWASDRRVAFDDVAGMATGDPRRDLQALVARVERVGERTLLCDVTTPDVRETGLAVVRAIIPGFHPLVMGHRQRALGGTRLWEVPQRLGYPGISRADGDNPAPHPYP